jgi:hypothetical protein
MSINIFTNCISFTILYIICKKEISCL